MYLSKETSYLFSVTERDEHEVCGLVDWIGLDFHLSRVESHLDQYLFLKPGFVSLITTRILYLELNTDTC